MRESLAWIHASTHPSTHINGSRKDSFHVSAKKVLKKGHVEKDGIIVIIVDLIAAFIHVYLYEWNLEEVFKLRSERHLCQEDLCSMKKKMKKKTNECTTI